MKKLKENKKLLAIIIGLILIAGIVMLIIQGFNKSISYEKATKIECYIAKGYDKSEIKQIANEVFSDKDIEIQDVEKLNQVFAIKIKNYTEEEFNNFKTKIAEKYDIKEDELETYEIEVPGTRIRDLVSPYVFPVSLVTILSVIYVAIRNIKEKEMITKVAKLLTRLMVVAGLYFSIIVIAQIPVNAYTMPMALALYVATLLLTIIKIK